MTGPRLDVRVPHEAPRALVLLLHGGQQTSTEPVLDRHASWWRMAWLASSMRPVARRHGLAVHLLQNGVRGWNDPAEPAPVIDARWALDQLRASHPGLPIVLVGHSMGGRTACRVADDPAVTGVVALAPWLPDGEPTGALRGKRLHVLHGTRDRWTSAAASSRYVERARATASQASWQPLRGVGHFMFRRIRRWDRFVEDSVLRLLDDSGGACEQTSTEGRA